MNRTLIILMVIAGSIICNFFMFNLLKFQFEDYLAPMRQSQINLILGSITMGTIITGMFFLIPKGEKHKNIFA